MDGMDFFSPLSLTVPRIAYSVLHQRKAGVREEDYVKTLLELTRQAVERSNQASGQIRGWRESRVADVSEGGPPQLAQRMSALLEAICPVPAVEGGMELATIDGALFGGVLEKPTSSGREYLASLGFRSAEGDPPVHESILFYTGSWNYDFIEHVVRDQMGIYEDPHLQHVHEMGPVIFFTQNQVAVVGDALASEAGEWQPTILFAKGKPRYDDFRGALARAMEEAVKRAGLRAISLWQRKLGLGNIFEWELRMRCAADPERLARAMDVIAAEAGVAAERVTQRGRLLLFRRLGVLGG